MNIKYKKVLSRLLKKVRLGLLGYENWLNKDVSAKKAKKPTISIAGIKEGNLEFSIMKYFAEQGQKVVLTRELLEKFNTSAHVSVHDGLNKLLERGYIERVSRGRYVRKLNSQVSR